MIVIVIVIVIVVMVVGLHNKDVSLLGRKSARR